MKRVFYQRYIHLCEQHGVDPCSRRAAALLGTNRATISHWRTNCSMPKGEMISRIADVFHVSADYLLGRTDDPQDYANVFRDRRQDLTKEILHLQLLIKTLDHEDVIRLEGVAQGMLFADKYKPEQLVSEGSKDHE